MSERYESDQLAGGDAIRWPRDWPRDALLKDAKGIRDRGQDYEVLVAFVDSWTAYIKGLEEQKEAAETALEGLLNYTRDIADENDARVSQAHAVLARAGRFLTASRPSTTEEPAE